MNCNWNDNGPMLNAYPDSMGSRLSDLISVLGKEEFKDTFQSFYILPSIYNSDLDRGFSVIDYGLNKEYAAEDDIRAIGDLNIDLKLDFILNHASVLSPQFRDLLEKGEQSRYADFFINWNKFWDGYGEMTDEGYIKPDDKYIKDMFFRKPGLPILIVEMPEGKKVPYWNTFYQETYSENAPHKELMDKTGVPYLGQMDLNIKSELVWDFYEDTLKRLAEYGAKIVRLDAFAYAPKAPGKKNFLNEPDTWDVLEKVKGLASKYGLTLLPEIHAAYNEGIYEKVAKKGYMTYDFFLPGLLIYAIENQDGKVLSDWANELYNKKIKVVNMLGCHDGIPVLDLKGILKEDEIACLIDTIVKRGGYVKDLHGAKNMYYQVNATYYSALGEDDKKLLFARAIQMFMPGKPQIWYLDLFAGKNDHMAVKLAGEGGHKEINRTNLSLSQIEEALKESVVLEQLRLLKFRNTYPAFGWNADFSTTSKGSQLILTWENNGHRTSLTADFSDYSYKITSEMI